ncbi:MAG: DUF3016 domain-containing protein [Deltaproteobacteria bacterium]|nr:DUF3016 domain-containing protein [Deltaproteobacteria bacterium]
MKRLIMILMTISLLFLSFSAHAGVLKIDWVDIKRYSDIEVANGAQKPFEERVVRNLTEFFRTAAKEYLPVDQILYVRITDLDLAGDVDYFFMPYEDPVRVVKEMYFPSIEFSYELRDAQNQVIKSGSEHIRDTEFLFTGIKSLKDDPFYYEKQLIDNWFRNTFNK